MIFEVGKTYQHDTGELIPVGESEDNTVGWHEQTREEEVKE